MQATEMNSSDPTPGTWRPRAATASRLGPRANEIARIADKVRANERIDSHEALTLHEHADIVLLGELANLVRLRHNPNPVVTYIVDRNINPYNACITDCGFCAFYAKPKSDRTYELDRAEIMDKVAETAELGGRQVLMQGGHHPTIKSDWWCDLITEISSRYPLINCHTLSAPELEHFERIERRPVTEIIRDLAQAGWGSLPGGGAEMLVERVRKIIAPKKTTTDRWLDIHRQVHEAGLRSSATMMFGNVETAPERIEHLIRLRDLQDETGGLTAFACWNTQPDGVPEAHLYPRKSTPALYLRTQATARIVLDNVQHMQTSYVTQGIKMAQISLRFGCDDFGGTMLEENVVSAAGCSNLAAIDDLEKVIKRGGYTPVQRNSWYGIADTRYDAAPVDPARWPNSREEAAFHRAAGKGDFAIVPGPSESTPAFPEAARQGEGVALSKPIAGIRA
jgi:cyclic dehypoxanthinyl futalosine synthase